VLILGGGAAGMACARALACGRVQVGDENDPNAVDFRPLTKVVNGHVAVNGADDGDNVDIAIIEARDGLGGRAHTHRFQIFEDQHADIDLGAAFLHGSTLHHSLFFTFFLLFFFFFSQKVHILSQPTSWLIW
jgi:uncharacterized protein with NAD-binding domain and iron-sulfur cluster